MYNFAPLMAPNGIAVFEQPDWAQPMSRVWGWGYTFGHPMENKRGLI